MNIASLLAEQAKAQPHHPAVIFHAGRSVDGGASHPIWRHFTFAELEKRSNDLAWGLQEYGISPGCKALLMIRPALDFYALVFALLKIGAVPVLIDPGMGWKGFLKCVRQVSPEAFLGIAPAHILRLCCRKSFKSIKFSITLGQHRFWGGRTIPELLMHKHIGEPFTAYQPTQPDELTAVLFTSGSTGPAKGVCYTHEIFAGQCEIVKRLCGIAPGEYDLACFPLFSLFSIANGATAVIPDMDATHVASIKAEAVKEALSQWPISYSFGSPALWKHVGEAFKTHGWKLEGLNRIFMSGAPVPASTHQMLNELMTAPDSNTFAPYGCTEALPIAVLPGKMVIEHTAAKSAQGAGTCVGKIIPEIRAKVIAITDKELTWEQTQELPVNQIGELIVSGKCVTRSYYNRPDADALAKLVDTDGVLWHRVGDVGYFDDEGYFWFCGRKSHRVETAEGTLYSIPCEAFFNTLPGIRRSALAAIGTSRGTQEAVIIIECDRSLPAPSQEQILKIASEHPQTCAIHKVMFYPGSFPVDVRHNAKINREQLTQWATTHA